MEYKENTTCIYYEKCEQSEKNIAQCRNCNNFNSRLIKFKTIDAWNRPIFEVVNKNYYLSDVDNLFDFGTTEKEIIDFYKDKILNKYLTYHGKKVDSEPNGGSMEHLTFRFIED